LAHSKRNKGVSKKQHKFGNHEAKELPYMEALSWFLTLLVFALPLVFSVAGYNMFGSIRFFVLVVLTVFLLCLAFLSFLRAGGFVIPKTSFELPIVGLVLILVFSTITSVNIRTSLFGEFDRYDGLTTWLCCFSLLYLSYLIFRKRRAVRQLVSGLAISSSVIAVYGIMQHYGLDFMKWGPGAEVARSGSTLGNPCFLGAYIVLVIPLTISLAFCGQSSFRLRLMCSVASILMFFSLLFTFTRAAWLAFVAALILLFALNYRSIFQKALQRKNLIIAAVCVLVIATGLFLMSGLSKPYLSRLESSFNLKEGSGFGRLILWKHTLPMILERPVLGWGPDTFSLVFPRFMTPEFEKIMSRRAIANDAHNRLLQISASSGVVSVFIYLWIIILFFWRVFPHALRASDVFERRLIQGILAGCFAYLFQLMFNSSLLPADAIFWIFAGIGVWYSSKQMKIGEERVFTKWRPGVGVQKLATALVVLTVALTAYGFGKPVLADYHLRNALELQAAGDMRGSLEYYRSAANLGSDEYYLVQLGKFYSEIAAQMGKKEQFLLAIDAFRRARDMNPLDESSYFQLGNTYLAASEELDQSGYLREAEQNYQAVLKMDPNYAECHLRLGIVYARIGNDKKAIGEWKQATVLAPDSTAAYYNIGNYYKEKGKKERAIDYLQQGLRVNPADQRLKDALHEVESSV